MHYTDEQLRRMAEKREPLKCDISELRAMRVDGLLNLLRDELSAAPNSLPAPALTEGAIVAALKADPAMAGRVMVALPVALTVGERERLYESTHAAVIGYSSVGLRALQSLAVALAAASYRG